MSTNFHRLVTFGRGFIAVKHGSEGGQALITSVLAMATLLGMAALVIDAGLAFHERRSLQNAADAAALAGARDLPADPSLAVSRARDWALYNGIDGADDLEIEISSTYVPDDTITVAVGREVLYRFAAALGVDGGSVSAHASARIGSPAGLDRFIPLAVQTATLAGLSPGDSATLKYDSQDQTRGNTLALAFPGSSGAADFRHDIFYGSPQTFCVAGQEYPGCTSTISTEPGAMVGPTRQGIGDLIEATSPTCDTFSEVFQPDPDNPANMLINASCNPFPPYEVSSSKRLVILPVISELCAGRCDVQIIRFALFLVDGVQCNGGQGTCEVTGQYAEAASSIAGLRLGPYNGDAAFTFARLVD